MGTHINVFEPSQQVYVIVDCIDPNNSNLLVAAVRPGTIVRVNFAVLVTDLTPGAVYDVQIDSHHGTTTLAESDIFTDKAAAVVEYIERI